MIRYIVIRPDGSQKIYSTPCNGGRDITAYPDQKESDTTPNTTTTIDNETETETQEVDEHEFVVVFVEV